ncbi:hypothetical protein N8Z72_00935 [Polaribacter sp.]|jgi:hypothetical protein|nr:hypothetical protein [Polaribacter sp.]
MGNSNSGRKSKEEDQKMIEELSKFSEDVYEVLHQNILAGKHWAIRIWFERMFGKSKESKDLNLTNNQEQPIFNLNFKSTEELNNL